MGRPLSAGGCAQACKALQTKAHGRSEIAKAVQSGAAVSLTYNSSEQAAAERHYSFGSVAVPGKDKEGRSARTLRSSASSEAWVPWTPARMSVAAPERVKGSM